MSSIQILTFLAPSGNQSKIDNIEGGDNEDSILDLEDLSRRNIEDKDKIGSDDYSSSGDDIEDNLLNFTMTSENSYNECEAVLPKFDFQHRLFKMVKLQDDGYLYEYLVVKLNGAYNLPQNIVASMLTINFVDRKFRGITPEEKVFPVPDSGLTNPQYEHVTAIKQEVLSPERQVYMMVKHFGIDRSLKPRYIGYSIFALKVDEETGAELEIKNKEKKGRLVYGHFEVPIFTQVFTKKNEKVKISSL